MPDFLPRPDFELLHWSKKFSVQLDLNHAAFGISPEAAAEYALLHAEFAAKLRIAHDPITRTRSAVAGKDASRAQVRQRARLLAGIIRANPNVDNEARIALGLAVRRDGRGARINRPAEPPLLSIVSTSGTIISVRLRRFGINSQPARPDGVVGAMIFWSPTQQPPGDLTRWHFARVTTRRKFQLILPNNFPPGTQVWLTAQWMNPRGQLGPASNPVSTWLGGGMVASSNTMKHAA